MTVKQLQALVEKHGLTISGYRGGAGKFRDLEIGVGAAHGALAAFRKELVQLRGCANLTHLAAVDNPDHDDYGKAYVEVCSFWWDEEAS